MKFIHLTDPHIVARPQKIFDLDVHARLEAAIASINANFADAELCMVTGDISHWGEPDSYGEFVEILNGLTIPWHPLIGNHDARATMRAALPDAPWTDEGFLQYALETSAGEFLVLDTLDDGRNTGYLCEKRLRWLRERLLETQDQGRDVFLFMHHPPFDSGIHAMDMIGMRNKPDLAAVVQGFAHIRHLFFGHLHRTCHGSWNGLPFSTVKATSHQVATVLGDASPLVCSTENPAYAVALIDRDTVVIHDHSYMEEDTAFVYDRGVPKGQDAPPEHQKSWS
ncbi:MAG: phosphodiesterase [Magnetovibrio sp.]|nr:phosphodiesterase [Magnetovibrio sp.]